MNLPMFVVPSLGDGGDSSYAPDRSARLDAAGRSLGHGVYFPGGGFMPCDDDDEDNCDFGSGDGFETSVFSPAGPDSKCPPLSKTPLFLAKKMSLSCLI
jgi:hypothetical protein